MIKRTLNNPPALVQSVAEIRGFSGAGHGQEGQNKGPRAHHAKLAVGRRLPSPPIGSTPTVRLLEYIFLPHEKAAYV
jgi:hypothetical protein